MRERCLLVGLIPCLLAGLVACGDSPDLVISEIDAPAYAQPGVPIPGDPSVTVENRGSAPAESEAGTITVDVANSLDEMLPSGPLTVSTTYLDDAMLPGGRDALPSPLSAGESTLVDIDPVTLPRDTPFGVYNLCAKVDSFGGVTESNEDNNVTCQPLTVGPPTEDFCIDFEESSRAEAVNGASSRDLYSDLGITFLSDPIIFRQPPLYDGFQGLFQGDPDAARPERSCGPLIFDLSFGLRAERVTFEARNVGFIPFPVHITAVAYGSDRLRAYEVDSHSITSQSQLGNLGTVENFTLESAEDEPPITQVYLYYATCPPHVALDNLCVELREGE